MQYQVLDWDSNFFGIKVARITQPDLNTQGLSNILSELKLQQVRLAYWPSDRKCEDAVIKTLGGNLADRKTTFAIHLRSLKFDDMIATDIVEPFTNSMPKADH